MIYLTMMKDETDKHFIKFYGEDGRFLFTGHVDDLYEVLPKKDYDYYLKNLEPGQKQTISFGFTGDE